MPGPELGPVLHMAGALFLVLAVILVGFWLLKRFGPMAGLGAARGKLAFEGQLALGPRRSVVVVRFLNKVLVLGVTEHQINLLTEMDTGHDQDPAEPDTTRAPARDFARTLDQAGKDPA
jgi:flagellar protein FliO/FliZ